VTYDLQFVDSIAASPTVRLNLNAPGWTVREGTEFGSAPLDRAVVSTLLVDGDRYPAAAYGNRVLSLVLRVDAASDDEVAVQLQRLYRELDRPTNILMYRPGTSAPVFFRTFRAAPDSVVWDPFTKEVTVRVPAEPFALGLRETLSAVTVYNDPAEGTTLNSNPYFETDVSGWTAAGGTITRSTAQFHEGAASMLLTPSGAATDVEVTTAAYVPVTAGQPVRLSMWLRCAVARNVDVFMVWSNGTTETGSASVTTALAANTWTLVDTTATAPLGTVQVRPAAAMRSTPLASHLLHIDEARIRQAGGVGGMSFDVSAPKGDVETPLYLSVRASDVARIPESAGSGRRQSVFAVRRGGTPSAMPSLLQAESMSLFVDTSVQAASGSSGTFLRTSFATATSLQQRASSLFASTPSTDVRGTYRVFLRCRKSVGTDVIQVQTQYANGDANVQSDLVTVPDTFWRWVDMGLVQLPLGYDPVVDGLSGVPLTAAGMGVFVYAARLSGSGALDLDALMFLPADDRLSFVKWPSASGETAFIVDSVAGQVYSVGASGEVRASQVEVVGGMPMVSPGVANRIWVMRDVGSTFYVGDDVTATVQVTPYYWPRYQHVRPVAS
jgi:hypothetical protein